MKQKTVGEIDDDADMENGCPGDKSKNTDIFSVWLSFNLGVKLW